MKSDIKNDGERLRAAKNTAKNNSYMKSGA